MIVLNNLQKVYGEGSFQVTALDRIDLEIEQGELIAIMGPSGSGKSTLLNMIGLLDRQSDGGYKLDGKPVGGLSIRERAKLRNARFGFVLQDFAVLDYYTVYQNVKVPLSYSRRQPEDTKQAVAALLKQLGMEEKMHVPAANLSGGQRQRVAIARALINNPDIILADEPTGALDQKTGMEVLDILCEINEQGKTVILVTHDRNVAQRCRRIIHLVDGRIDRVESAAQA